MRNELYIKTSIDL